MSSCCPYCALRVVLGMLSLLSFATIFLRGHSRHNGESLATAHDGMTETCREGDYQRPECRLDGLWTSEHLSSHPLWGLAPS